ncbi:MAG: endolytic transglycosylase MltG [Bacteroidetes bacterium]|nr:endolytic transglycosylase MltG [Bacteroidota bacterium]
MSRGGKRFLQAFGAVIFLSALILCWGLYQKIFAPNDFDNKRDQIIYIPTGSTIDDVVLYLKEEGLVDDTEAFSWVAEKMNYSANVKPGKYQLKNRMSNKEIVTLLRSGKQVPIRLTFSNIRTSYDLAGAVGGKIEADSASIAYLFKDKVYLAKYGLTEENSLCLMIPNTYEFKWNTSAEEFFERMSVEYKKFWTTQRKAKSKNIGLTQTQVCVLASIVDKETRKNDEKPLVAGVYMNRYLKGWKLEADPTLVYASGDFTIRRVLNEHKEIDSPYNTYLYTGLPPGPICMPAISSVDAVLNYTKHDFMFFCAREDFSGYHSFAKNYVQHLINARRFQKELDRRNIKS